MGKLYNERIICILAVAIYNSYVCANSNGEKKNVLNGLVVFFLHATSASANPDPSLTRAHVCVRVHARVCMNVCE